MFRNTQSIALILLSLILSLKSAVGLAQTRNPSNWPDSVDFCRSRNGTEDCKTYVTFNEAKESLNYICNKFNSNILHNTIEIAVAKNITTENRDNFYWGQGDYVAYMLHRNMSYPEFREKTDEAFRSLSHEPRVVQMGMGNSFDMKLLLMALVSQAIHDGGTRIGLASISQTYAGWLIETGPLGVFAMAIVSVIADPSVAHSDTIEDAAARNPESFCLSSHQGPLYSEREIHNMLSRYGFVRNSVKNLADYLKNSTN